MKNYCELEIKGLNQERFFNQLSEKYKVFDIKRISKNQSIFRVKYFAEKKVERLVLENNFEILSKRKVGVLNNLVNALTSYGLIAGIVVGGGYYFIQSGFVREIEVWGNEKISDSEIVNFIDEHLLSYNKNKINTKEVENKIYTHFSCFSFVSVSIYGQTLIVNVKEEIIPEEMGENFEAIYSKYDGIITDIELIQGTLCVEVGDIIQAGQILVQPYIINSSGEEMPVKPQANIYADVWLIEEEMHNSSYEESYYTGNKITINEVYVGKLKIYEKLMTNMYENFDMQTKEKILNKNNILPITLKTITYQEKATRLVEIPFDEIKEELCEKIKAKTLQKVEEYDIIKKENEVIKSVGNITTVKYIVTVSRNIGE